MPAPPEDIHERLRQHGQAHVLVRWHELSRAEQEEFVTQLRAIDLALLRDLFALRERQVPLPPPDAIRPVPVTGGEAITASAREAGRRALQDGAVAALVVAGGQGSRLGFEHPKGMFPVGPVSGKSLFQIHAEKVLALRRRYGAPVPFLVMTSPATHEETIAFFRDNGFFGLPADSVHFFRQGTIPALDLETGKLLLEAPGRVFTSPNGHGGSVWGLRESGLLDRLRDQGIRHLHYFQVDNPLVRVGDPDFLGHHIAVRAEVSSKVVAKQGPTDRLGNIVLIDGRHTIIEYSDLPDELARQTDGDGRLRLWAGSPAIHVFNLDFLARVTRTGSGLPFHVARKRVRFVNAHGQRVQPERENALKFEMFIFDVLPLAERWSVVETRRDEEFVPLKNASGPDSPEMVRAAIANLAGAWLERAGVRVPRRPDGSVAVPLEISPLYALDAEQLAAKVDPGLVVRGPTYLE